MNPSCIFCRIVARLEAASVVLDSERVLAFMDLRQFHAGHVLVVPKEHLADIYSLRDVALGAELMSVIGRVSRAVRDVVEPNGMNTWQSTGEAAGQEVPHLHFHVLPRFRGDGLLRVYPSKPGYPAREELDLLAMQLKDALAR